MTPIPRHHNPFDLLTVPQREAVETYQAYNVPASWFVGIPTSSGQVEIIALGANFIWSFIIQPDGDISTHEAAVSDFNTGIEI